MLVENLRKSEALKKEIWFSDFEQSKLFLNIFQPFVFKTQLLSFKLSLSSYIFQNLFQNSHPSTRWEPISEHSPPTLDPLYWLRLLATYKVDEIKNR